MGNRTRLGRDYYVQLDSSDYSVDPTAISRFVDVAADLERVSVRLDGTAGRSPQNLARGQTVADPVHVETAKQLRWQYLHPRIADPAKDLHRDLADYDRAFGLSVDGEAAS